MRNFNSSFDRSLERYRKEENTARAALLDKAAKRLAINPESFRTEENGREIDRDKHYVEGTKENFEESKDYHAKALEHIFQFGVAQGRWLNDSEGDNYRAEAVVPAEYDDFRNRIDLATTVFTKGGETFTFGIDFTTNPTEEKIREKILHTTNDYSFDAPAGFSQLKYYVDSTGTKGKTGPIPRYCIGIDNASVDNILDRVNVTDKGVFFGNISPITAFKILHEMAVQNELFEMPLYTKQDDETITPEEEALLRNIESLDGIYLKERERIKKQLPEWALRGGDTFGAIAHTLSKVDDYNEGDETFANILKITEQLSQDTENDPSSLKEKADAYRPKPPIKESTAQALGKKAIKAATKKQA